MMWIQSFPLPPSVNEFLAPIRGRLVKTQVHREYHAECLRWATRHRAKLMPLLTHLKDLESESIKRKEPLALTVDCYFVFHRERLLTKKGTCKMLDVNNRLKPLLDGLVSVLGIDDKYFFAGNCEKVMTDTKDQECSIVKLETHPPRTHQHILSLMKESPSQWVI